MLGLFGLDPHGFGPHLPPGRLQGEARAGLAAHLHVPVRRHRGRNPPGKIRQHKQLGAVPVGAEHQLVFLPVEAQFKGRVVQRQLQRGSAPVQQFLLGLGPIRRVDQRPQLFFRLAERGPGLLHTLAETAVKLGQGQPVAAVVDELLGVLVAGAGFQRLFKVVQRRALLVQVVPGVPHAEVPAVVVLKIRLVGGQQPDGLAEQLLVARPGQVVIGPGQLAVQLGGALVGGQRLDGVDDVLVRALFVPARALLQQIHGRFPFPGFVPAKR